MKRGYLLLILLVPVAVFAVSGDGEGINDRAVTPSGSVSAQAQATANDRKLLGLDSNAKPFLQSRSTKPASHVKGLNNDFADRLAKFFKAGEAAGQKLTIYSGYRSIPHQATLFKRAVAKYGSVAEARKFVAPPGKSNHNYGKAVDLRFNGAGVGKTRASCMQNKACKWAHNNAGQYGLKFPMSWEPWHIEPGGSVRSGGEGQGDIGQGSNDDGTQSGNSQTQKPQSSQRSGSGGQSGSGQSGTGSQSGNGTTATNTTDPYGIWTDPVTGETVQNVASINCDPGTIGGTGRSLIEWSCGGESTRSRGGTTRLQSRFNTKGKLTGKGYARPSVGTTYKVQCLAGDKVVGEAMCRVSVGASTGTASTSTGSNKRAVLHISAAYQSVGWGGETAVQWATIGASNCTVKGGIIIIKDALPSGSASTGKLYKPTTYILECDTNKGSKAVKAEVKIR